MQLMEHRSILPHAMCTALVDNSVYAHMTQTPPAKPIYSGEFLADHYRY